MRFCRQGPSLVVHTPAKLNLFLEVRGRRPDGYHELESLMVSIGLFDTLRFSPESSGTVTLRLVQDLSGPSRELPTDDRNLILRAARLLAEDCHVRAGASIDLIKRIPVESGLGGGSSDAAATLVALDRLWNTQLGARRLHQLAAQLGSDVNFFLDSPAAALCQGRGEEIHPVALSRRLHFVVVRPRSGLSTREVFGELDVPADGRFVEWRDGALPRRALRQGSMARIGQGLYNRLERAAGDLNGDVARLLREFGQLPVAGSGMTGSGSACYALCRSARQARMLGKRLRASVDGDVWSVSSRV